MIGLGLILLLTGYPAVAAESTDQCIVCHAALPDSALSAPARSISEDVHTRWGISCADCHGGDPAATTKDAAKARSKGYRGAPRPQDIPARCGSCHSDPGRMHRANPALRVDQEAQYRTSVHGMQLARGDTAVATCISCHGAHGMLAVDDPRSPVYVRNVVGTCTRCHSDHQRMTGYTVHDPVSGKDIPLPTNQGEHYLRSVHARALYEKGDISAPTCNDCHGNHGAVPPGVATVAAICRQCHVTQADIFDDSVHRDAFADAGYPECTSCHANHEIRQPSDAMVGSTGEAVCARCHDEGDDQIEIATRIRGMLDSLSASIGAADTVLTRAAVAGMDVAQGRMDLREATNGIIQSRNYVHSVDEEQVAQIFAPASAKALEARAVGEGLLHEVTVRRQGLAVSLLLIALLAVGVIMKIRQLDRKNPPH